MCGFTEKKIVSGVFASTVIQSIRTHADPRNVKSIPPNGDEKKRRFALLFMAIWFSVEAKSDPKVI